MYTLGVRWLSSKLGALQINAAATALLMLIGTPLNSHTVCVLRFTRPVFPLPVLVPGVSTPDQSVHKMGIEIEPKFGDRRPKLPPVLAWFMNFTTIGGLCQAHNSNNAWSRVYWLTLFSVGFLLTLNNVWQVYLDVQSRKVSLLSKN